MDDLKLYAKSDKGLESLVQTIRIFSADIGMDFGVTKCANLVVKRGKPIEEGIKLPDGREIKNLGKGDSYKYLGVLESDEFKRGDEFAKKELIKEYFRRVRKILQSKLDGVNIICGINTRAVSLLRYSASFLEWTREELKGLDRRTRKYLTMYGALRPRDSVARTYLPRRNGGRGLTSVEDAVDQAIIGLANYVEKSDESLLSATRKEMQGYMEDCNAFKRRRIEERINEVKGKALHGQFLRETEGVASDKCWPSGCKKAI